MLQNGQVRIRNGNGKQSLQLRHVVWLVQVFACIHDPANVIVKRVAIRMLRKSPSEVVRPQPCEAIGPSKRGQFLVNFVEDGGAVMVNIHLICDAQRKVFTTPLLTEAKSDRNTDQFTKKKSGCQRGGVRGVANQNATTERTNLQTKRCSKDEAAALRKNHVVRPMH